MPQLKPYTPFKPNKKEFFQLAITFLPKQHEKVIRYLTYSHYFENGSSVEYAAKIYLEHLQQHVRVRDIKKVLQELMDNNVLIPTSILPGRNVLHTQPDPLQWKGINHDKLKQSYNKLQQRHSTLLYHRVPPKRLTLLTDLLASNPLHFVPEIQSILERFREFLLTLNDKTPNLTLLHNLSEKWAALRKRHGAPTQVPPIPDLLHSIVNSITKAKDVKRPNTFQKRLLAALKVADVRLAPFLTSLLFYFSYYQIDRGLPLRSLLQLPNTTPDQDLPSYLLHIPLKDLIHTPYLRSLSMAFLGLYLNSGTQPPKLTLEAAQTLVNENGTLWPDLSSAVTTLSKNYRHFNISPRHFNSPLVKQLLDNLPKSGTGYVYTTDPHEVVCRANLHPFFSHLVETITTWAAILQKAQSCIQGNLNLSNTSFIDQGFDPVFQDSTRIDKNNVLNSKGAQDSRLVITYKDRNDELNFGFWWSML